MNEWILIYNEYSQEPTWLLKINKASNQPFNLATQLFTLKIFFGITLCRRTNLFEVIWLFGSTF